MATETQEAPVRTLPNGDLWRPNYGSSSDNVSLDDLEGEGKSSEEKVEEAVEGGNECPWCGQTRESKQALREHITAQHASAVQDEEKAEKDAARAMARRGRTTRTRDSEDAE